MLHANVRQYSDDESEIPTWRVGAMLCRRLLGALHWQTVYNHLLLASQYLSLLIILTTMQVVVSSRMVAV